MNDDDEDEVDYKDKFYNEFGKQQDPDNGFSLETEGLDETPFPFYMQQLFPNKTKVNVVDQSDDERGKWDSQFEYLLSCIGYAVGLGNIWRFPSKVYKGGGGAFLLPYLCCCLLIGVPMMMLEMGLGQFCGQSCSKAFECVPICFGLGWLIFLICFIIVICYCNVISYCLIYFFSSFQTILPWSVCSNSFNTPICVNVSAIVRNLTNLTYESSTIQYWNFYVTGQKKADGSYYLIDESIGRPIFSAALCLIIVLSFSAGILMFGVKVSGKVIYLTVIFPYVAILQFIILGCTLPGALKGIQFYLYPDPVKLLDPMVFLSAIEQLFFSSGIATGGLITMASFNRFHDKIIRNVVIVILTDFLTSFISGFATFPVLGYMSFRSGKEIKDLVPSDSSLFFITYPEALSTLSNANLWSILFMLMAVMLGIDSLFVLLETVIMAISDYWSFFHVQKNRIILTITICLIIFFISLIFITPGGNNWITLFESRISPFVLTFSCLMEILVICVIYGHTHFLSDFQMMTDVKFNVYLVLFCFLFISLTILTVMMLAAIKSQPIKLHGNTFPQWTQTVAWCIIALIISPLPIGMCFILIKNKINYPGYSIKDYMNVCINPPPTWGPKLKRNWVQSDFYSKKLLKYKNDPKFIAALSKNENMDKLVYKSEKRTKNTTPR